MQPVSLRNSFFPIEQIKNNTQGNQTYKAMLTQSPDQRCKIGNNSAKERDGAAEKNLNGNTDSNQ